LSQSNVEMDQYEKSEATKKSLNTKLSSSVPDIDQLCNLIDESTFGLKTISSNDDKNNNTNSSCLASKFPSVPSCHVKAFRSSRLKRLYSSSRKKCTLNENESDIPNYRSLFPCTRRTFSMRFSLSSSLLNRFRSLSTHNLSSIRRHSHLTSDLRSHHSRYSSSTITLFRTKSILPAVVEEETNPSTIQSQLSCSIVDTRRTTANSCNVEELAAYLDNFLYLPKSLSGAAELMYT
jgi:hypothetical protein